MKLQQRLETWDLRRETLKAFTLVELLVVVAIIAILLAMLAPALDRAIGLAEGAVCMTRLRQLQAASSYYAMDNNRVLPPAQIFADNTTTPYETYPVGYGGTSWWHFLTQQPAPLFTARPYIDVKSESGRKLFFCPTNPTDINAVKTFNYAWHWELSFAGGRQAWRSLRRVDSPMATLLVFDQNPNFAARANGAYHAYFSPGTNHGGINTWSRFYQEYRPTWHDGRGAFVFVDGHSELLAPGTAEDDETTWHRLLSGQ